MRLRCIIDFFLIGSGQRMLSKSVDDMWTKSWFTKESIGMFLFIIYAIRFLIINSSSTNISLSHSLSYAINIVMYIYIIVCYFISNYILKYLYFVNSLRDKFT